MNEYLGTNFVWFFGVVEDRNDPLMMGRVRVRCYYWHTEDKGKLPTSELPWAQVTTPVTNAAMGDVGQTPIGLVEGTWVMGFFLDGEIGQKPMVLGSILVFHLNNHQLNRGSLIQTVSIQNELANPMSTA